MFNMVVMLLYLSVCVSMPLWVVGVGCGCGRGGIWERQICILVEGMSMLGRNIDLAHCGIGQESAMISCRASWKHTSCASPLLSTPIVKYAGKALKAWTQFARPWNIFRARSKTGVFEELLVLLLGEGDVISLCLCCCESIKVSETICCRKRWLLTKWNAGVEGEKNMKVGIWQMWQQQQQTCKAWRCRN